MSNEPIEIKDLDETRELTPEEMEQIAGGKGAVNAVIAAAALTVTLGAGTSIERSMLEHGGMSQKTAIEKMDKLMSGIMGEDDETQAQAQPQQKAPGGQAGQIQISEGIRTQSVAPVMRASADGADLSRSYDTQATVDAGSQDGGSYQAPIVEGSSEDGGYPAASGVAREKAGGSQGAVSAE